MKTPGQIAYEAEQRHLHGDGPCGKWERIPNHTKEMWEFIAQAVLDAQWKPASEPPATNQEVEVCDFNNKQRSLGNYESEFGWCADKIPSRKITHYRELPPMPEGGEK